MAEALASSLLEKLKELKSMMIGDEKVVEQLERDVQLLRNFLRAPAKWTEDESWGYITRDICNVLFKLEDTVDIFLKKKVSASRKSSIGRFLGRVSPLAATVRSLREQKVRRIIDKFATWRPTTSQEEWWTMKKDNVNLMRRDKVVGLEDDEAALIERILEEKKELDIICIYGMHGLGKTTLASRIYENERIAYEFQILWINISPKFNKRDMLTQILKMFTIEDLSRMSDDELSADVRVCFTYKKFLLVLDDVCSHEDWETIRNIFTMSNGRGKVLITTSVTSFDAQDDVYCHHMDILTDEESWKLLQLEVFGDVARCPVELESIGRDIAEKCDGLPLSVVTAGQVLRLSMDWKYVARNLNSLLHNEESLLNVVELAYRGLPYELRCCFLYMGVFPEDYEISRWTLIRLWIAEGFVQSMEGRSLEEIASQYLDDLISRSLVMASKINSMSEVKTCRVSDMIRVFCLEKARQEGLFQVIKGSGDGFLDIFLQENCRRLCLHLNSNKVLQPLLPRFEKGSSFLYFNKSYTLDDPGDMSAMVDAFQLLKVWESKSFLFDHFPRRISKLFLLRYITLSVVHLDALPETISHLQNLQTLVVHTSSPLIRMKANIWSLMQLRHLKTNAVISLNHKQKGKAGENLQTLDRLSPESCTAHMCERARNLKTLGIQGSLDTFFEDSSLSKLNGLEKLKLMNDYGPGSRNLYVPKHSLFQPRNLNLPKHGFFPPCLKRLTLSNTLLPWKCMSTLSELGSLEVLKLKHKAFIGKCWSANYSFTNLRFLRISDTDLIDWEAKTSSFPQLRCLVLSNCEKLTKIPLELTKTLEILDISGVLRSVVECSRKVAEIKKQEGESGFPFSLTIRPRHGN